MSYSTPTGTASIEALGTNLGLNSAIGLTGDRSAMLLTNWGSGTARIEIYEANGTKVGSDINLRTLADHEHASYTNWGMYALSSGNVLVTYNQSSTDAGWNGDAYFFVINQNGTEVVSDTKINVTSLGSLTRGMDVAQLSNGNLAISYQRNDNLSRATQVFDTSGNAISGEVMVASNVTGMQTQIAASSGGGYMVSYEYNSNAGTQGHIDYKFFNNAGVQQASGQLYHTTSGGDTPMHDIYALSNGNYLAVLSDWRTSTASAKIFEADGDLVSTISLPYVYQGSLAVVDTPGSEGFVITQISNSTTQANGGDDWVGTATVNLLQYDNAGTLVTTTPNVASGKYLWEDYVSYSWAAAYSPSFFMYSGYSRGLGLISTTNPNLPTTFNQAIDGRYQIDAWIFDQPTGPDVSSIVRTGGAAATAQGSASSVQYTVTFSEAVTGVGTSDFTLTTTGTASGSIASITGSGTTYTVTIDTLAGDGTLRLDLNSSGTGIQNGGSQAINGGFSGGQTYTLDHTVPTVGGVTSSTTNGSFKIGDTISIQVNFSEVVTVTGTPQLTLETGSTDRVLNYASGSGSSTLTFTYVVAAGDVSADLDYAGTSALALNGGTIKDGAGNDATLTLPTPGMANSLANNKILVVDGVLPLISSVSAANVGAAGGTSYSFTVTYADADTGINSSTFDGNDITVTGPNAYSAAASYVSAAGNVVTYSITPPGGSWDTGDAGSYTIALNANQVRDMAGNAIAANASAGSFAANFGPTVSSIVRAGGAGSGVAASATAITYTVTFSEAVTGVDTSDFTLTPTGTASGAIASISGSGTTYTVTVDTLTGDGTLRLDVNSSGTNIENGSSAAIVGGYVGGQTYLLDHTAPAAPSAPDMSAGTDSGTSSIDDETGDSTPTFTGTAEANATVTLYDSDGSTVLGTTTADGSGNWSITPASAMGEGPHTVTAKATDAAGNVSSASNGLNVVIDLTAPAAPTAPDLAAGSDSGSSSTDDITSDTTPTVSGTAEAGATVTLYDTNGSTVLGTTTADGSGNWSITSTTLSQGSHTLTAKATDSAGNTSTASTGLAITIDTGAPAAPSTPDLASASDSGRSSTDNVTQSATPTLTGTAEANATVTLYDTDGTTVLGTTTADGSGNWSITSTTLSEGAHTLTAKATDAAGNTGSASSGLAINVDVTAPAAPAAPDLASGSDSGSSNSDDLTHDSTPTVSGTAEADATVTLYDTDGTTVLGTTTADGSGNWSITASTLAEGSHTLTAKATDAAGNTGSASTGLAITVDTTAPATVVATAAFSADTGASATDFITQTAAQTVSGTLDANLATGELVEVSLDNGSTWSTATTTVGQASWSLGGVTLTASNTLKVRVTDAAGNSGSVFSQAYVLDTTAPAAPATPDLAAASDSGTSSTDNLTSDTTPTVTGTAEANATVTLYDSDGTTVLGTATADGSGNWSITASTLSEGAHTLTAKATDAAGNTGVASSGLVVTIDTTAPTTTAASIALSADTGNSSNDFLTKTAAQTVSGTLSANLAAGEVVQVSLDNGATWNSATATTGQATWSLAGATLASSDTLKVRVLDAAGNAGTAASQAYVLDTTAPTCTITVSDAAFAPGETATVTFTFSEAVTGFTNADVTVPNGTLGTVSSSDGGLTWTVTYTPTQGLLDLTNVVTLDNTGVTDAAGNAGTGTTDSANFTIDTTDNVPPLLQSASVNLRTLVLSYSDENPLNAAQTAAASAFTVTSGGVANAVTAVSVDATARTVTLTLQVQVLQGEVVTVAYADPSAGNDTQAVQDSAGNDAPSIGPVDVTNLTPADVTPPTVVMTVADTDLSAGETTTLTLTFNEPVSDLALSALFAPHAELSNLVRVDAFTWTVQMAPQRDSNFSGNVVTLDATKVHDRSGNAGIGSVTSNAYGVRTLDPGATITLADGQLTAGETTQVTVSFDQAVSGLDLGDFAVQGGALSGLASADGGRTWTATLTPAAGYNGNNNVITLNLAGLLTAQGQPGHGTAISGYFGVDTQAPTLAITSDMPVLAAGQTATLTFAFSELPVGFTAEDISVSGGTLGALRATDDPRVFRASFVPAGSGASSIVVANGSFADAQGNAGTGASFSGPVLDATAPVFDAEHSSPADGTQAVAVGSTLVLAFSEPLAADLSTLGGVALVRIDELGNTTPVSASVALDALGRLVVTPAAALAFDSRYVVTWSEGSLKDAAGNAVAASTSATTAGYDFRTAKNPATVEDEKLVDGVTVDTTTTPNGDGSSTVTVDVNPVDEHRNDDPNTPNSELADIVIGGSGSDPRILVSLAPGSGVRAFGTENGSQNAIGEVQHQIDNLPGSHIVLPGGGGISQALTDDVRQTLPGELPVVRVVTPQVSSGSQGGTVMVVSAGNISAGLMDAVLIDGRLLPGGSTVQLQNIDFAALVGDMTVTGGDGRQVVVGDAGQQTICLGADDDWLRGGGGDDIVASLGGNDTLLGDEGNDLVVGGIGNDTLEGGAGNDVLQGGQSDAGTWSFQIDAQGVLQTRFAAAHPVLGGLADFVMEGAWSTPGRTHDSDPRLAYSYQSTERLQLVSTLFKALTGTLPDLAAFNHYAAGEASTLTLGQEAWDYFLATHPQLKGAGLAEQVTAVMQTVWGSAAVTPALVAEGVAWLQAGGSLGAGMVALAQHPLGLATLGGSNGGHTLVQPYVVSESGFAAASGNDVLRGGGGNDRLVGGGGSDRLDGGSGIDTAVFTGSVLDFSFRKQTVNGELRVLVTATESGDVDTLVGIERWEIGGKTYVPDAAMLALADGGSHPLAGYLVELVGQQAGVAAADLIGG